MKTGLHLHVPLPQDGNRQHWLDSIKPVKTLKTLSGRHTIAHSPVIGGVNRDAQEGPAGNYVTSGPNHIQRIANLNVRRIAEIHSLSGRRLHDVEAGYASRTDNFRM